MPCVKVDDLSSDQLLMQRRKLFLEFSARTDLRAVRIAVLGGSTTSSLVEVVEVLLLALGFRPVFYESEYGRFYEEAVHDPETLIAFKPEIIYVHTSCLNVPRLHAGTTEDDAAAHFQRQADRFRAIWDSLESKVGAQIIQNNFELPPYALFGNMDASAVSGQTRHLMRLNEFLAQEANRRSSLLVQDVHSLSSHLGLANWFDWDRYYSYKIQVRPQATVALARSLAAIVGAIYGKTRKVLVLDLDNTLWGGVIGDDGVENIKIGRETPMGEAYTGFQEYCMALRERGVLLAVCSKNSEEIARSGFYHPSSVLKLDHFSCFKANWFPKHQNIEEIAKELNLGLDSLVFVDDNPAERAIVAAQLPSVAVPNVGTEVSQFAAILDAARYFEPAGVSREDIQRASLYTANSQRSQQQSQFATYDEFLDSLNMTAEIEPFKQVYLERIAQLTNKSNQYNLTTRRYTLAELQALAASQEYICLYGILRDTFGDNGLISVLVGHQEERTLWIDLWLMSCRVLKRDMEHAMLDALVHHAQTRRLTVIRGVYLPTKKNAMVADHYERLGFIRIAAPFDAVEGATYWSLVLDGYFKRNRHIKTNTAQLDLDGVLQHV